MPVITKHGHQAHANLGLLAHHPQRRKIIDAILDTVKPQTTRQISAWTDPHVSHSTIAKLAKQVRLQAQQAAILVKAQELQAASSGVAIQPQSVAELTRNAVMGQQHLARIQQHQARIDAALAGAESASDISTLIKTDLAGIRLSAELDGSLALSVQPQVVNNTQVIVLPQFAGEELEPAIDVPSEHV